MSRTHGPQFPRTLALLTVLATSIAVVACSGTADPFLTGVRNGRVDSVRPIVVGTLPGQNEINVPTNSLIQITFSEAIDSTSVSPSSVSFTGGVTGTLSVTGASVTLLPIPALRPGTTITGTISGIRDRAGNAMAAPYVWSFTTAP